MSQVFQASTDSISDGDTNIELQLLNSEDAGSNVNLDGEY